MSHKFTAVITQEEKWYVALCIELGVVSQGHTIDEAKKNLQEAVELYLESFGTEDLPESNGEVLLYPLEVVLNA
ncbi:type II toxin-antitoxin system HicB family antitoxin [Acidobacteriota bacterium]